MTRRFKKRAGDLVPLSGILKSVMPPPPTPVNVRRVKVAEALRQRVDDPDMTFHHAVLCQLPMPYKPWDKPLYHVKQGKNHLWITNGHAINENDDLIEFPIPYGPMARLVHYHLATETLRQEAAGELKTTEHGFRRLAIDPSMTAFAKKIGIRDRGAGISHFKQIFAMMCAANWSFGVRPDGPGITGAKANIIQAFDLWYPKDEDQRVFWDSFLLLHPGYVNGVVERAVPLAREAIGALQTSAMALDIYSWLVWRLQQGDIGKAAHRGVFITWQNLYEQFGQGYDRIRDFRRFFSKHLKRVLEVYPEARVREELRSKSRQPAGIRLFASPPPIRKKLVALK